MTPSQLLATAALSDASRPLITSYDETTGERVELSVATALNWVAKLGNAMVDEWALEPGDSVGVDLPAHWVGAVVVLAVWEVGADVIDAGSAATAVVRRGAAASLTDRELVVTLAPFGLDLSGLVAAYPDQMAFSGPAAGDDAVSAASALALPGAARVLSVLDFDGPGHAVTSLVAALVAGGSVVVVRDGVSAIPERLQQICEVELVTHTAGIDVIGLPRVS